MMVAKVGIASILLSLDAIEVPIFFFVSYHTMASIFILFFVSYALASNFINKRSSQLLYFYHSAIVDKSVQFLANGSLRKKSFLLSKLEILS